MNPLSDPRKENAEALSTAAGASPATAPEPWMRGTHTELDVVRRAVVHALELALEDAERWAAELTDAQMFSAPSGLAPVAFHLRHAVRSLDRLLTYAEGRQLDARQLADMRTESDPGTAEDVRQEFRQGIASALDRLRATDPGSLDQPRGIGRKRLPSTVGGLLIHCAEHTQRHVGAMIVTAKLVRAAGL